MRLNMAVLQPCSSRGGWRQRKSCPEQLPELQAPRSGTPGARPPPRPCCTTRFLIWALESTAPDGPSPKAPCERESLGSLRALCYRKGLFSPPASPWGAGALDGTLRRRGWGAGGRELPAGTSLTNQQDADWPQSQSRGPITSHRGRVRWGAGPGPPNRQ